MSEPTLLRGDCARCTGLCCVALPFGRSADFAIDKPAGTPCPNLGTDSRCGIHDRLRPSGFTGCTVYDCFGAGQRVTQLTFGGRHWRESTRLARQMFDAFAVVRPLHELLWYVAAARTLPAAESLHDALDTVRAHLEELAGGGPEALAGVDVAAARAEVDPLLQRVSELARAGIARGPDRRRADLVGARLRGADLRGCDLRGALLIGADLRGADLRRADLIGADLRATDLRGADLTGALFVTQPQLEAAVGDLRTRLPDGLARPSHWHAG